MASILDDLKGILSEAEYAKLAGNSAVATRLTRGDELRSFYDGEEPPPAAHQDPPPQTRTAPPPPAAAQFDLGAIERMLDAKIGTINTTIETKINDVVSARGNELVNNAVKIALQRSDELNRIYIEHSATFGEPLDSTKLNEFLEANKDKNYRTIREAYDAFVGPRALEREVDRKVAEKLAAKSGENVPGTTPAPATNSNIRHFMKRTGTGAQAGETGASRAASALDRIMTRRQENVA